ncbi:hypothetical protein M3689_11930 [Alkalihalophilus marmarensis]|uniref:hypothetical protein n=1 Tax=Alkalihalophilus marmarensis TaxID=521377 RepID=UPI0020405A1D|nr:hypothetical protein [Alkalihalophilus marmarensis]MCM3490019.1 hypothetical protein [Alkalihalophilus marmarensis]
MKKKLSALLLVLSLSLGSITFFAEPADALLDDRVINYYDRQYIPANGSWATVNTTYKTIYFQRGYTYTESVREISTWQQKLLGVIVNRHTRNYSTY